MARKLLLLLFLLPLFTQAQTAEQDVLFSHSIGKNIKTYKKNCNKALKNKDFTRVDALFDTLVDQVITGTTMDNFKVRKLSGRQIELHSFENPVFLMTYASWCPPGAGEIPALNEIAKQYKDQIDIVVLFWDSRENAKKAARAYSSRINVVYVDEMENKNCHVINSMKHSVGFPTSFFIDKDKSIVDLRRGVIQPFNADYTTSYNLNFKTYLHGISLLVAINESESDYAIE